jgi:uncharacterized membrane protein YphA (DoxX/SURF4 family)
MNAVFIIARVLFVLLFLGSAFGHIAKAEAMAGYAQYKGAPGGKAGVILSGVALGVGALSVLLGIYGDLGALLLAATLVPITFFMHAFWKESDAQAKQTEQIAFNKNLALIGGALAFFLLYAVASPLGASITGSFFHLS